VRIWPEFWQKNSALLFMNLVDNNIMKVKRNSEIESIRRACFPGYKGRTFRVEPFHPMNCRSYWDGGSRSYFCFLNLATGQTSAVPENGSPFVKAVPAVESLPENTVLVEEIIFCGKNLGLRIYGSPEFVAKFAADAVLA
jgi:hypothetical protein